MTERGIVMMTFISHLGWRKVGLTSNTPTTNKPTQDFAFTENSGSKNCPPPNAKPIQFFDILFTLHLLSTIVSEINRYDNTFVRAADDRISLRNKAPSWVPVTMKGFHCCYYKHGLDKETYH